jgi:hypothetical protein
MDNQEWFQEVENLMSEYLNQYNQSRNQTNTRENYRGNNRDVSEHRLYLLLNEFIQDYDSSMRLYQENMRDMIQLLREFRTGTNSQSPPPRTHRTNIPQQPPAQQIPQHREQPPPSNNTPLATTTFAYFIQPLDTETQQQQQQQQRLSSQQIERAIECLEYDESMALSYNENNTNSDEMVADRCPICLEDFEIGEEILRIRVCGHIFKRNGLMNWFQRNSHCPVCRRSVIVDLPPQNAPIRASNNLLDNHIRAPLMRELGNFIQTVAQNNRQGSNPFSFFDFSFNEI